MSSVSRTQLTVQVGDARMPCHLKRHLSPHTVGAILRMLPISGNAHRMGKSIVYIETGISSGIERARTEFAAGDIAFYPAEGSICFFTQGAQTSRPMTPVGKVEGDAGALAGAGSGDIVRLYAG